MVSYKKNYFEPSKGFASDGYEPWKGGNFYKINAFAQSSWIVDLLHDKNKKFTGQISKSFTLYKTLKSHFANECGNWGLNKKEQTCRKFSSSLSRQLASSWFFFTGALFHNDVTGMDKQKFSGEGWRVGWNDVPEWSTCFPICFLNTSSNAT